MPVEVFKEAVWRIVRLHDLFSTIVLTKSAKLKLLTGKDAKVSDDEYKRILLTGIAPRDHSKSHEHFWFLLHGQMKSITADRLKLRSAIWEYWSAYQSDEVKTAQSQATFGKGPLPKQPVLPGPPNTLIENPILIMNNISLTTPSLQFEEQRNWKNHGNDEWTYDQVKG